MRKKIDNVDNLMQDSQIHVLVVTETWHKDSDCITIKRLRSLGYNVIEEARPLRSQAHDENIDYVNQGEIALVSKPGVVIATMDLKLKVSTFEYLCCRVMLMGASTVVVTIYRPGS